MLGQVAKGAVNDEPTTPSTISSAVKARLEERGLAGDYPFTGAGGDSDREKRRRSRKTNDRSAFIRLLYTPGRFWRFPGGAPRRIADVLVADAAKVVG